MSFIGQNTMRTKHLNRSLVFQSILRLELPSRLEIAAYTKLTPATITNIIGELMEEGLVVEIGNVENEQKRAGRKTVVLDLNEDSRRVAGIHIRSDRVELGIVTIKGKVIASYSFTIPKKISQSHFVELLINELQSFLTKNASTTISCIGIGSVGLVDFDNGLILEAEHLGWKSVELVSTLSSYFHLPVYLDHHVRGMALAEKMFGSCKNESDFLCVFIGQGIGSGLYLRDQLFRSELTGAGEIGHIIYQPEGIPCWCGSFGCLERYASEEAIMRDLNMVSIDEIILDCKNNSRNCFEVVKLAGKRIAVALTSLINMLHVEKIIIGGKLSHPDLPLLEEIRRDVHTHSFLARKRKVEIETSLLGDYVGIIGAASIALLYGIFTADLNYVEKG